MDTKQNHSHTKSVELPPDQALRIVASKESGSFLLLSVSEDPIYFGKGSPTYDDFSSYSNVQVFLESIAFTGDLLSQHGISISCNDVTIVAPVSINATGAAGADQVIGGLQAQAGHNGGLINFYVQSGSAKVSEFLSFVTDGGKGGDVIVKDAQAGDGGNGGHSVRIFQSCYSSLLDSIYKFLDRNDASEDKFESLVHRDDPIYLSAYQLLIFAASVITQDQTEAFGYIEALRKTLTGMESVIACKVRDLVIKVRFVRNSVDGLADNLKRNFGVATSFTGGYPGSGKGVQGVTGAKGKDGSDTCLFLSTYHSNISNTTFAFAHPEQCTMLLDRAKVLYYMGSPQLRMLAKILFQRLVNRLSFLPAKTSSTESSNSLRVSKLKSIKTEAANWLIQLVTGVCFNGHPANWAPRASYKFYDSMLDTALADHAAFENAYIQYHAALAKQQKLTVSVDLALQQTSQMISNLKIQINELVSRMLETESLVISLTEHVKSTHAALQNVFVELKERIRYSFDLSVPQVMNALRCIAFSPTKGMFGVEAANLIYEGFTSVPDVDGRPANKTFIISKIKCGETTVKSFKDKLGQELDGEFKLEDPFGTYLMVAEEDMMDFLEAYANSSFADVIPQMKKIFDNFVDAVVKRNEQAILYNIQLKLYVSKIASKKEYEQKEKDFRGKEIEANNIDLPNITAYMGDIYQSSRARAMQLLDILVRSLTFRMLKSYDIYELAFQGTEFDKDKVPRTITSNVLRSGRSRIQNEFGNLVEIWGSEPAHFPQDFNNPRGKRIYLSNAERDDLIRNLRVVMTIPVVEKDTIQKNDFSGCCNVRIYRVRFGLTGLKTKTQAEAHVSVTLTHSGSETIMDRKNLRHKFEHDPISTKYSFNLHPDGKIEVQDNGNIGEGDVDNTPTSYAAPGPFAGRWTVDLRDSRLVHLDFSKVTGAYFDFCGTNYAFPTM